MTNIKCVEVVVKEKPAPPEERPPEEKIPWEYIALGAGIAVPVVGILVFSKIVGKGYS